jgi:VanZ family protein
MRVIDTSQAKTSSLSPLQYWLPPLIWMAAIFYFSTDTFSGEQTGSLLWRAASFIYPGITEEQFEALHFYVRKAGHFTEYALLALLLFRAFRAGAIARWRWSWAAGSLLIVVLYALSDEYHQTFTRHRVGSIYDSLTDIAGGASALLALWLIRRKRGN